MTRFKIGDLVTYNYKPAADTVKRRDVIMPVEAKLLNFTGDRCTIQYRNKLGELIVKSVPISMISEVVIGAIE